MILIKDLNAFLSNFFTVDHMCIIKKLRQFRKYVKLYVAIVPPVQSLCDNIYVPVKSHPIDG